MSKRICIFGDSITWGAFDEEKGGWANRLKIFFEADEYDYSVYNLGVSGDNTEKLLLRFDCECKAREPEVIVFAIGINDSQYVDSKDNPRIALHKFKNNMEELIGKAKKFTNQILFIGITLVDESKVMPIPWDTRKYYDNENIFKYNQVLQEICKEGNLPFLDMTDILEKEDLSDGLHPNTKGHEKIFKRIKDFFLENLK